MRKKPVLGLVMVIGLLVLYLLFWPISPRPVGVFVAPEAPPLTGVYERNSRLQAVERFGDGQCLGPEDITVDAQGYLYAGMDDGRIMRFETDGDNAELFVNTGGRPQGMAFDADGNLIVADAEGLLSVAPDGSITVLATKAGGRPIVVANDLAIAADGTVYFSDYRFYPDYMMDFVDGRPLGRLLAYDPGTRMTRVVLEDLYAANGVTLGPDESFVLIDEMAAYRVTRYWLTGPKQGQTDIFIENLPGLPDNITFNGQDTYWIALYEPRSSATEFFQARPFLRGVLRRIPPFLITTAAPPPSYGFVVGVDLEGNITHNLQDPSGEFASHVTCAYEYEGMLYLGNIGDTAIKRLPAP